MKKRKEKYDRFLLGAVGSDIGWSRRKIKRNEQPVAKLRMTSGDRSQP